MFTRDRDRTYEYMQAMVYSKKLILIGTALSVYAFLLLWPIESELLLVKIHTRLWYNSVYLFDIITIIIYIAFMYDVLKRKVFPLQRIIMPSLWAGTFLFIVLAKYGNYESGMIFEVLLLSIVSLAFPMFWISSSLITEKHVKEIDSLLNGTSLFIMKVRGRSMYPTIIAESYVIFHRTDDNFCFRNDDIVAYEPMLVFSPLSNNRYVTHIIVDIDGERITTRRDNIGEDDPPIKRFRIHGIAIASYNPNLGLFSPLTDMKEIQEVMELARQITTNKWHLIGNITKNDGRSLLYPLLLPLVIAITLPILFLFIM